jgi:hypothetical protein
MGDFLLLSVGGVIGLFIILSRMPPWILLSITSNLFIADLLFTILMYWIHWGTFSGMAVATITALLGSGAFQALRKMWGYKENGVYIKGLLNVYRYQSR